MGKGWDDMGEGAQQREWHKAWLAQAYRVLKPNGLILAFNGTRTHHHLSMAMQQVGFTDLSVKAWAYGCLSADTEILTPEGWVQYHKAKVDTLVMGFDPASGDFTWQKVQQTYEYPYDETAYHVHGEHTDHIVSRDHRCLVQSDGQWVFVRAQDLGESVTIPVCKEGAETEALVGTEGDVGELCGVREPEVVSERLVEEGQDADLLQTVQWNIAGAGMGEARPQGCGSGVARRSGFGYSQADGGREPSLEGRGDNLQEEGQLQGRAVRPLPNGVSADGPQGRLCDGTPSDCGADFGAVSGPCGSGSPHESQPHGQPSGKLGPVQHEQGPQAVRTPRAAVACVARVEPIHYNGIVWCVKVETGAFVARRNGQAFVTGNSGFPKSLNVQKFLDKQAGKQGEVIGTKRGVGGENMNDIVRGSAVRTTDDEGGKGVGAYGTGAKQVPVTLEVRAPATEESARWAGFGSALKPAWEPILCARKPLDSRSDKE